MSITMDLGLADSTPNDFIDKEVKGFADLVYKKVSNCCMPAEAEFMNVQCC
jgi:hypothetical protein